MDPFRLLAVDSYSLGPESEALDTLQNTAGPAFPGVMGATPSLTVTVARILNTLFGILGIVFVVLTLYAGFLWMTAGGNEEQITKAKNTITRAAIGLAIILTSYSLTRFVVSSLLKATVVNGAQGS